MIFITLNSFVGGVLLDLGHEEEELGDDVEVFRQPERLVSMVTSEARSEMVALQDFGTTWSITETLLLKVHQMC